MVRTGAGDRDRTSDEEILHHYSTGMTFYLIHLLQKYLQAHPIAFLAPKLREQIHQMKWRSGLKDIYQNNIHDISPASMKGFLRFALLHLSDPAISKNSRSSEDEEVDNIDLMGVRKLKAILKLEARLGVPSRFIWGSMHARNTDIDQLIEADANDLAL